MNVSGTHQFTAKSIATGQAVQNQSNNFFAKLGRNISRLFQPNQLAVQNQASGHHIATNVTQAKLAKLEQANVSTGQGHTAKNLRRSERILAGMGIPTQNLGNELKIRLARIAVQDPALAHAISTAHEDGVTGAQPANLGLDLARIAEKDGLPLATQLAGLLPHVTAGRLNTQIRDELMTLGRDHPTLTGKLAAKALHTGSGAANALSLPQLTWLIHTASTDNVLHDLHGPNFAKEADLPNATTLGFTPALHIPVTDIAVYQQLKTLYGTIDGLEFDDDTQTIHSAFQYQQLTELAGGISDTAKLNVPDEVSDIITVPFAKVEYSYGNPQAVRNRQDQRLAMLENCIRDYSAPDYTKFATDVPPTTLTTGLQGKNDAQALKYLLGNGVGEKGYPGISISESHNTTTAKVYLKANMANLASAGVNTIYIEHIPQQHQALLDEYLQSPQGTQMPVPLERFLKGNDDANRIGPDYPNNLRGLVESAKQNNMRIVGLDDNNISRRVDGGSMEVRDMGVNRLGAEVIGADAGNLVGGKYIILAGAAHNHSHAGLLNGIPGFAQLLSIPAVRPNPGGGLDFDADNPANRHA